MHRKVTHKTQKVLIYKVITPNYSGDHYGDRRKKKDMTHKP